MKVELCNLGRIKVTLIGSDFKVLNLNFGALLKPSYTTRLILQALYKVAAEKLKVDIKSSRVLIEAYPFFDGGVLYFTPLQSKKTVLEAKASTLYAFDFFDGGGLLNAIEQLYSDQNARKIFSKLYDVDGVFRLVLAAKPFTVCEFCDCLFPFNEVKKYTCEHGRVLTGDNAICEIGEKLTKPLNPQPPL